MQREEVLAVLKAHEAELRARGVAHVALFGFLARGDARPDSDVDLTVEIDPESRIDLYDYIGVMHYLQDLFIVGVDVANHETLKEHVRPSAERDATYAF